MRASSACRRSGSAARSARRTAAPTPCTRRTTTFFERGADRMSPFSIPLGLPNTAASAVAREHGLHGPSSSIGTACAAGSDAIGMAFRLIRDGSRRRDGGGRRRRRHHALPDRGLPEARRALARRRRPDQAVAAVRPGPRRLRDGRGRRHPRARGPRPGRGPRRADPGGGVGLRPVLRRRAPHRPRRDRRRPGPGGAAGARGRRARAVPDRVRERARHLDAGGRHRGAARAGGRGAVRRRRSRRRSRSTATRSARRAGSRRWRR